MLTETDFDNIIVMISSICPWKSCRKTCLETSWAVFWSQSSYKKLKLAIKPFTGRRCRGFLIQMLRWKETYAGSGTRFSWKFSVQCYTFLFLPFSSGSMTELCSFWYGLKDLFTLHKSAEKMSLTFRTDDVTVSGRKDVDAHGWLRAAQGRMG